MRQLVLLDVDGGESLGGHDTFEHDCLDALIADVHAADVHMHQRRCRGDQLEETLAELVDIFALFAVSIAVNISVINYIITEAQTLQALLCFKLDAE